MKRNLSIAIPIACSACSLSPPHYFDVTADDDLVAVDASFANSRRTKARLIDHRHAEITVDASDSSGVIRMRMKNGDIVECLVGYVTNGELEPHRVAIRNGTCDVRS